MIKIGYRVDDYVVGYIKEMREDRICIVIAKDKEMLTCRILGKNKNTVFRRKDVRPFWIQWGDLFKTTTSTGVDEIVTIKDIFVKDHEYCLTLMEGTDEGLANYILYSSIKDGWWEYHGSIFTS